MKQFIAFPIENYNRIEVSQMAPGEAMAKAEQDNDICIYTAEEIACEINDENPFSEVWLKVVDTDDDNIRQWYLTAYPTDELGKNIDGDATFKELWQTLNDGKFDYDRFAADDSIVRERVFERLAQQYHVQYNVVCRLWRAAKY